ncbi:MAG TPA: ABC transporter permease, partial [Alphaproteobacteria bacterium]|nr:ABC transporter permease [Alphaproteobacteria bacterium]
MSADDAARAEPRRSFRLVLALMRKEALQIRRDPSSISIAFVLPLVLLLLFGYGVSLDADHVRLAMVVETPTAETQALVASFANSPYFEVERRLHRGDAEAELEAGRVKGVVVLASDFSRELARADGAPIQLMLDGTDANTARLVRGYVDGVWASWLQQRALEQRQPLVVPLLAEPRVWFNPQLRSRYFLIPGLIGIIMALIGTLLTALVVAREWERGTMESLLSTPATGWQVLAGKLVPYFVLGLGAMALSVI